MVDDRSFHRENTSRTKLELNSNDTYRRYMPTNGGGPKIGGKDRRDSLEFHTQLEDDRVHTVDELKTVLDPIEESKFKRKPYPSVDLEHYLKQKKNKHWGNLQYKKNGRTNFHITLQYSPWLKLEEDTLIQGRLITENEITEITSPDLESYIETTINESDYLEPLDGDNEICWVSIPTEYDTPLEYMDDIKRVSQGINLGNH